MDTVKEVIEHYGARLLGAPESVSSIGAVYKLQIEGQNGGTWLLRCKNPVSIEEGNGPADCTLIAREADFIALANRKMNPQLAFLTGKLKVSGDMSLALRLARFL